MTWRATVCDDVIHIQRYNDWVINKPEMVHSHVYEPYPHTILATDDHFINKVILGGEEPLSSLRDAVAAQKILDAADRSVAEGRHINILE